MRRANGRSLALIPLLPLLLLVLFLPVLPRWLPRTSWTTVTLYDWHRIIEIGVLILCLALSFVVARGKLVPGRRLAWTGATIILAGCLSAFSNQVPWWDVAHEMALMSLLVIAFSAISRVLEASDKAEVAQLASICLVGSALLYLAVFFAVNADSMYAEEFYGNQIMFPCFSNVRFFSDYQALVVPFLVFGVAVYCRSAVSRVMGWLAIFLFVMLFFYSGSRAFVFGQLGTHVVLGLVLRRRYWPFFVRQVMAWGGGYLAYLCSTQLLPYLLIGNLQEGAQYLGMLTRSTTWDRNLIWAMATREMLGHFWLGIGPGEFSRHLNVVAAAPHNSVLMIGAEWGVPVLILLLANLVPSGVRSLRETAQQVTAGNGEFAIAAWQALLALALHSLVANVVVIPTSQLSLLLAALLASCAAPGTRNRHVEGGAMARSIGYAGVCLVNVAVLAVILGRDIPRLPERNRMYFDCMRPSSSYSPRFWQQGWKIDHCPTPGVDYQPDGPATSIDSKLR